MSKLLYLFYFISTYAVYVIQVTRDFTSLHSCVSLVTCLFYFILIHFIPSRVVNFIFGSLILFRVINSTLRIVNFILKRRVVIGAKLCFLVLFASSF